MNRRVPGALVLAWALVTGVACTGTEEARDEATVEPEITLRAGAPLAPLPVALTEVAGSTYGDGLLVVGGLDASGRAVRSAFLWVADDDAWLAAPDLPVPLHHAQVVEARGRAFVVGGFTVAAGSDVWVESAAVFSLASGDDAWRSEPALPSPTGALGAAATADGTIVAMGGVSGGNVVGTTHVLVPGASAWERGPDLAEPREHLGATTIGDRVFATGGRVGSLESNKTSVESWDPSGREGSWQREPSLNQARGGIDADGRCVAGGEEPAATIATIECLDNDGERWTIVGRLETARHGLAVVAKDTHLHVISGGDRPGLFVSSAHEVFGI